jgi:hypothetical protein
VVAMTETTQEAADRAETARITYGYLRWLMICLPALLFVVTVLTAVQQGELETSISAYYGGPVRDIFVGCLVAVAACLVAYQGVGLLEDYTLNGAGFYAVFVALVPTGFAQMMEEVRANPTPDGLTVADHVWFLRIALTCVLLLCVVLFGREISTGNLARLFSPSTGTRLADTVNRTFVILTMVLLLGFLVLAMRQLWLVPADEVTMEGLSLGPVQLRIHDLAAIFLIASLAVAVVTNTWPFYRLADLRASGRLAYLVIVVLMVLGPLVAAVLARVFAPGHWVILLEWWEIALFALFWFLETRRIARVRGRGREIVPDPEPGVLREPQRGLSGQP